jgi:IclR family acetate operon transcriptional repressor
MAVLETLTLAGPQESTVTPEAVTPEAATPEAVTPEAFTREAVTPEAVLSSASKALAVLEVVAQSPGGVIGVSALAAEVHLPRSTIHRILKDLEDHGFVGRHGSKYRVGNRFFKLTEAVRWSEYGELRDLADDALSWLFDRTASTVNLAVLDGADVLYIEKITGPGGCRVPSRVGGRFPATCTALGKAILAFSDPDAVAGCVRAPLPHMTPYSIVVPRLLAEELVRIRRRGIAHDLEEATPGIACTAAPILVRGIPVAAISVSVPTGAVATAGGDALVRQAAERIARNLTPD